MPRLVIGIYMTISAMKAPTTFFISYHCMAHRSRPESTFENRRQRILGGGEGLAGEYDDPTTSRAGMAKEPNIELFRLLEGRHPVDHALERVRIA